MKIEKLTENKIRIILNIDELAEKNIDFRSLVKDTDVAQKLFKKILKQAEKEVGFDTSDSRLLIEAFVSSEGLFIITFTKISNTIKSKNTKLSSDSPNTLSNPLSIGSEARVLKVKRKMPSYSAKTVVYEFNRLEEFCNYCTYLNGTPLKDLKDFAKKIMLYEYKSKYFLVFSNINTNYKNINLFYSSISEFAKLVSNSAYLESELIEYGKVFIKNNAIKNGLECCKCL